MVRGALSNRIHDRLRGLDLAPFYQDCILRSHERRETYDAIAGELCDYGLQWGGALVDAKAFRCKAQRLSVYSMRYGDEVRIRPDLYRDFVLVHVSVRKGIEIETDGRTHHVPEGRVFFSSPKHSIALRWQEDCEQVLIRFPHDLLFRGKSFQVPLSAASLSEPLVVPFVHQLSALLAMARQPSGLYGFRQWQGALQETLVGFVAASLGVSQHSVPSPETIEIPETRTRDRLESLDAFIRARLDRPIRHIDLEVATGLGHSQLNQLVQKGFGCSPMMLVRQRRLEAVRQSLEADPGQDLTQLSLLYGFDHQGRFAQYYRGQFGEAPSETRRRLRGQRPAGRNG